MCPHATWQDRLFSLWQMDTVVLRAAAVLERQDN
jgi:hypothetical protein